MSEWCRFKLMGADVNVVGRAGEREEELLRPELQTLRAEPRTWTAQVCRPSLSLLVLSMTLSKLLPCCASASPSVKWTGERVS